MHPGETSSLTGPTIYGLISSKEKFRLGSLKSKQELDKLFKSNKYSLEQQYELYKSTILDWLAKEWNRMRQTNFKRNEIPQWKPIEVFVKSYIEFLKTVNLNQAPNKNSMVDLLQLLYLDGEGSKLIWTKETKLLSKIKNAFPEGQWGNIIYQENVSQNR